MALESHIDFPPKHPLNTGDHHRPGCRGTDTAITRRKGQKDVGSGLGMVGGPEVGLVPPFSSGGGRGSPDTSTDQARRVRYNPRPRWRARSMIVGVRRWGATMEMPLSKSQRELRGRDVRDMSTEQLHDWIDACSMMERWVDSNKARRSWKRARAEALAEVSRRRPRLPEVSEGDA